MFRRPSNHRFRPVRRDPVVITALLVAVCVTILGGCTKPAPPRTPQAPTKIRVAAATDLRSCLDALTDAFQIEHPNVDLLPTFGASGVLLTQLKSGLETDLYLSADVALARDLAAAGLAAETDVFESGQGRLVVWVRNESPLDVARLGVDALRDPAVRPYPARCEPTSRLPLALSPFPPPWLSPKPR
jgi:molybdate transport system substrate-binding protein